MGLFDYFFRRRPKTPYINKEDFIEEVNDNNYNNVNENLMDLKTSNDNQEQNGSLQGRQLIDNFLFKDYDRQGYQDALINPDSSNAESSKEILKSQLEIIIDKALSYYNDKIKDFDFHIKTRNENGMLDTVAEIESEKLKALEEVNKIEIILSEAKENKGKGHIIVLSYEKGFKRGLAAITAAKLFGKSISDE